MARRGVARTALLAAAVLVLCAEKANSAKKKGDRSEASAPFFLMDSSDYMCLRPDGFGSCDMDALWLQVPRGKHNANSIVSLLEGDPKASCLERVGSGKESKVKAGKCSKKGAKRWEVVRGEDGVYYVTEGTGKKAHCIVRGSSHDKARNLVSTQECRKGATPLRREATTLNSEGFFLRTLDKKCFDGDTFRTCSDFDRTQLFGLGLQFTPGGIFGGGGDATRSIFHYSTPSSCINRSGRTVKNGQCKGNNALDWSMEGGMLMQGKGKNKYCLVRLNDNKAEMRPCKEGVYEFIEMVVPPLPQASA